MLISPAEILLPTFSLSRSQKVFRRGAGSLSYLILSNIFLSYLIVSPVLCPDAKRFCDVGLVAHIILLYIILSYLITCSPSRCQKVLWRGAGSSCWRTAQPSPPLPAAARGWCGWTRSWQDHCLAPSDHRWSGLASLSNLPLETEVEKPRAQHLPVNNLLQMVIKRIFFPALSLCQVYSQCTGGGSQGH